jgi:branched-chain amino acid transport system substrate-binding protein
MKSLRILAIAAVLTCTQASAGEKSIKIGILGDQSGPYSDLGGAGSVLAAQRQGAWQADRDRRRRHAEQA